MTPCLSYTVFPHQDANLYTVVSTKPPAGSPFPENKHERKRLNPLLQVVLPDIQRRNKNTSFIVKESTSSSKERAAGGFSDRGDED